MSDPNIYPYNHSDIYSDGVEVLAPSAYIGDTKEVAAAVSDAECARTGEYPETDDDLPQGGTVIDASSLFGIWDD
jgi:hypothetical protein